MNKSTEKPDYRKFRYVDFACARQPGFRKNVVDIKEVPALAEKFGSFECYATFFLFSKDILDYMKNNLVNERSSVAGYNGVLHATYFPLDIDCCSDLALAKRAAIDAIEALRNIGVDEFGIKVYFSGSKGFHIQADSRFFGVTPSERLNLYFSEMRKRIAKIIGDNNGLIDQQIKDSVRLLRLPNTINAKSGLYKVRLYESEYRHFGIDDIKELARKKRILHDTDLTGLLPKHYIGLSYKANRFYLESAETVDRNLERKNSYSQDSAGFRHNGLCEAKKIILNSHIEKGERNNCALILASYFRESGRSIETAKELLSAWNQKNAIGLPDSEIETVVKSAYSKREPYKFGCNSLVKYCPFLDKKDYNYLRK